MRLVSKCILQQLVLGAFGLFEIPGAYRYL